jgi:excisionase family DNA binding protein
MENPFELILQRLDQIELLIKDLNNSKKEENKLLNIKEVAELLKVTVPTIYGYTHKNSIPYMKKGKKIYFYKNEIDEWLREGKNNTINDLDIKANKYLSRMKN